jgi:DNA-binding MarR family transcriptional regulator
MLAAMSNQGDSVAPVLHDRLAYLLKHGQLALAEHTGPALARLGITGRELAMLTTLAAAEAPAQHQAADRLGVDRTTMVDLVDGLERKHLVERRPDPADRRRNLVHLTATGRRILDEGSRAASEAEEAFLSALDPGEAEQLRSMLQRVLGLGAQRTTQA